MSQIALHSPSICHAKPASEKLHARLWKNWHVPKCKSKNCHTFASDSTLINSYERLRHTHSDVFPHKEHSAFTNQANWNQIQTVRWPACKEYSAKQTYSTGANTVALTAHSDSFSWQWKGRLQRRSIRKCVILPNSLAAQWCTWHTALCVVTSLCRWCNWCPSIEASCS